MPDRILSESARLFYLVGPSGAGKDSLIAWCRPRLLPQDRVLIAPRYITRPAAAGGECHVAVSEAEFVQRRDAGLFALHWASHDARYGIGIEIDDWLARGFHVLVNGSRAHLDATRARYGARLRPILVRASQDTLRARLTARGREDPARIDARLRRARRFAATDLDPAHIIDNDGAVADAGDRLLALLRACGLTRSVSDGV